MLVAVVLACAAIAASLPRESVVPPLLMEGIAENPCFPQDVIAVPGTIKGTYEPGSSVLRVAGGFYLGPRQPASRTPAEAACARSTAAADQQWLSAGDVPGTGTPLRSMATRALLDLRLSVRPNGGVIAGWRTDWEYSWPRDSSWVAVALADTGHLAESLRILRFLARTQLSDGTWAARYWPDGSGPVRDGRPAELDGVGWVPWAAWSWFAAQPSHSAAAVRTLAGLWPMITAAGDAAMRSLTAAGLPAAAMDYWEHDTATTLGTAAPLLTGLRAAADIASALGKHDQALRWGKAAARLAAGIQGAFGRYGYQRVAGGGAGADAAVTFLGPPFATPSSAVVRAAASTVHALTLPDGGLSPGTSWPGNATTAWTAETAFSALFSASTGNHQQAGRILSWLAGTRTRLGALAEQVDAGGRPVSVAPLAWTDAVVLLALLAQDHRLPVVPVPPS